MPAADPEDLALQWRIDGYAEIDELLEKARRSTDQDERARLYREMQEIVQEDAPWVFVASWRQNAVSTANVENFRLQPSFVLELHGVGKD